jgi:hypothetical protein
MNKESIIKFVSNLLNNYLNDNSYGIAFKTFNFISSLDTQYEVNYGKKQIEHFYPVLMGNFTGDYIPLKLNAFDCTLPIQIIYNSYDFDKIVNIFNEFKTKILGEVINQDNLSLVASITLPSHSRAVSHDDLAVIKSNFEFATEQENISILDFTLSIYCGDKNKFVFGNNTKYFILYDDENEKEQEEEIIKINSEFTSLVKLNPFQLMSGETVETVGENNSKSNTFTFFDNDSYIANKLIYIAETGQIQNYKLKIKKQYLNNDGTLRTINNKSLEFVDYYNILSFDHTEPIGEFSQIVLALSKAITF